MATLGRVTNPRDLDANEGPRARLEVKVPPAWLAEGAEIEIAAPRMLACDRCGGGGCDGCARSGALRAPDEARARLLRLRLPGGSDDAVRLRIPTPFERGDIAQLMIAVVAASEPSAGVVRVGSPTAPPSSKLWWAAAVAAAAAAAWFLW